VQQDARLSSLRVSDMRRNKIRVNSFQMRLLILHLKPLKLLLQVNLIKPRKKFLHLQLHLLSHANRDLVFDSIVIEIPFNLENQPTTKP